MSDIEKQPSGGLEETEGREPVDASAGQQATLEDAEDEGREAAPQDVDANGARPAGWGMPRIGLVSIIIACVALSLGLLQSLASTVGPMFLALNLLIAAYPIYTGMMKLRVPKLLGAILTMLAVFLVLIVGIGAIIWSVTQVVTVMGDYSQQFTEMYYGIIGWLGQFGLDQDAVVSALKTISPSNVLDFAGSILSSTSATTGLVAVMIVGIVFMTFDIPSMQQRLGITQRTHPDLTDSISAVANGVRRYWVVTTLFGLVVALINGGIIIGVGVSLPMVWIVLTFVTNYIPNIGFVIGLVPPALLALVEKGPVTALIVVISFCVVNFILQSLIQPKFAGEAVGITPIVSFISLLVWAWVFGPIGALIALPATLTVKALLIDPDPRMRWVNAFISNDPSTAER